MLVKDVKIKKIEKLLQSLPDDLIIDSINLTNGYEIHLRANPDTQYEYNYDNDLEELNKVVEELGNS